MNALYCTRHGNQLGDYGICKKCFIDMNNELKKLRSRIATLEQTAKKEKEANKLEIGLIVSSMYDVDDTIGAIIDTINDKYDDINIESAWGDSYKDRDPKK